MRRSAIPLLISAALAAGACSRAPAPVEQDAEATPVSVTPAQIGTLLADVNAAGVVGPTPGADWTIYAPETARIVDLPKAEGDPVKQGDLLVKFDIPSVSAALAQRQTELEQAKATFNAAQARAAHLSQLASQGLVSRHDLGVAQAAQTAADTVVNQAEAAVQAAQRLADSGIVTARFDGVVAKRWHNPGDIAASDASDPVLRVIDPTRLEVIATILKADAKQVVPGRAASVVDPASRRSESATVVAGPIIAPGAASGPARLTFAGATAFPIDTPVTVHITADSRQDALIVPTVAVIHDNGETFVMVAGADHRAHETDVTLGLVTHDSTQITGGLAPGDLVITRGQDSILDNAPIVIVR